MGGATDALVIMTKWKESYTRGFNALGQSLHKKAVFDRRNLYDPKLMASFGLDCFQIGRLSALINEQVAV
jgi:UDPglucose 6-dehydrogenase